MLISPLHTSRRQATRLAGFDLGYNAHNYLYIMEGTRVLTWAMPVDYFSLGSRLESFLALKPKVTTFICCIKHADGTLQTLSPGLVVMIARFLHTSDLKT